MSIRVIVAGGRYITNYSLVESVIRDSNFLITELVSGRCDSGFITYTTPCGVSVRGVDGLGEKWAHLNQIPVQPFPAIWEEYGKFAGPMRNKQMAHYADGLILIWDGKSRGSSSMKDLWLSLNGSKNFFEYITITS